MSVATAFVNTLASTTANRIIAQLTTFIRSKFEDSGLELVPNLKETENILFSLRSKECSEILKILNEGKSVAIVSESSLLAYEFVQMVLHIENAKYTKGLGVKFDVDKIIQSATQSDPLTKIKSLNASMVTVTKEIINHLKTSSGSSQLKLNQQNIKPIFFIQNLAYLYDKVPTTAQVSLMKRGIKDIFSKYQVVGIINDIEAIQLSTNYEFNEKFVLFRIKELTESDTFVFLKNKIPKYEQVHEIKISDDILIYIINMATRYLSNTPNPKRSTDLLEATLSNVWLEKLEIRKKQFSLGNQRFQMIYSTVSSEDKKRYMDNLSAGFFPKTPSNRSESLDQFKNASDPDFEGDPMDAFGDINLTASEIEEKLIASKPLPMSLDEAGGELKKEDVLLTMEQRYGLNVKALEDSSMVQDLIEKLSSKIIGQDEAIRKIVHRLFISSKKSSSQMKSRGVSSIILLTGSSGTGKTETAKVLSEILGRELKIFPLNQNSEEHSVSQMFGPPPGYKGSDEGGLLTNFARKFPSGIVLLDEMEKAADNFISALLTVFDEGKIPDGIGRMTDFTGIIFILTTNAVKGVDDQTEENLIDLLLKFKKPNKLTNFFTPEFLGRIDEIVYFKELGEKELRPLILNRLKRHSELYEYSLENEYYLPDDIERDIDSYVRSFRKTGVRGIEKKFDERYKSMHLSLS